MARFVTGGPGRNGPINGEGNAFDPDFAEKYPAILEYLTLDRHDDGKVRQRATLTLAIEDGVWKCCLNDRDQCRSSWVTAGTAEAALEAQEAALASGTPSWRLYQPWGKKKK